MKKSIAVIGLGRFGLSLVESFSRLNVDIIAIDQNKESVKKASEFVHNVYVVDSTDEEALKSAGISNVDHAIVALGQNDRSNLTSSIITIIKLKQLGVKQITARADEDDYEEILKLVGATDIVSPLYIASERVANKIASGNVIDYFNIKNDFDVFEIKLHDEFESLPITQLDSRSIYGVNILLIERGNQILVPSKDTVLMAKDEIFIFGKKKDIPKIVNNFNKKEH
ncbi:MAG TPA: TrkA family potassium uptake protein [Acholeplasma sp.]|jgi:trk system potassium uptake protein TrkA|nr:TrkA family potassium uptake protein [Acholeplasma sp.]